MRIPICALVLLLTACGASQNAQPPQESAASAASTAMATASTANKPPVIAPIDDLTTALAEEAAAPAKTVALDTSCEVDSDCAVKDVGSCCGAHPSCVNVNSPTFPDQVKAACGKENRVGICGFPAVSGCKCQQGKCADVNGSPAQ